MNGDELPPGWAWAPIGDLCTLINGRAFKPTDWKDRGLPIIRIQNLNNRHAAFNRYPGLVDDRHLVNNGDLLFAWSGTPGTSFGAHVWQRGKAVLNQHIFRVIYDERFIDRDYFRHAINWSLEGIIAQAHGGAGLAHITKGRFEETCIPLPPLRQQEQIARDIGTNFEELDEAEAALARAREGVEQFRASLLHAACTGQLTAAWREANPQAETGADLLRRILAERRAAWERTERARLEAKGTPPHGDAWKARYEEPAALDLTDLPDLPRGWTWAALEQICEIVGGITVDAKRVGANLIDIPYLRVANVQRGRLKLDQIKTLKAPPEVVGKLLLRSGDILLNEGGDRDKLGRGWVWNSELEACIHQNHVFRARPYVPHFESRFISYYLNEIGRNFFFEGATQTVNLASINMSKVSRAPVPLPPAAEMEEIVTQVTDLLADSALAIPTTGQSQQLRQSILHAAFTGKLVPQDPADEPAAALLARLRAAPAPARRTRRRASTEAAA